MTNQTNTTKLVLTFVRLMLALLFVLSLPLGVAAQEPDKGNGQGNGQQRRARASQALLAEAAANPSARMRVIIQTRGGAEAVTKVAQGHGGNQIKDLSMVNAVVMELPAVSVRNMAMARDVEWISVDAPLVSSAESWSAEMGWSNYLATTGVSALNSVLPELDGSGVTVAVIDSGINEHKDLDGHIVEHIDSHADSLDARDEFCHGTHVAGIIGASGYTSNYTYRGVAPGVDLINVKVSGANGMGYASDLIGGLQWVYENAEAYNIKVANISLNSTLAQSYKIDPICAAVEMLWVRGVTVVVSAGNNGNSDGPVTLLPPANDPFVITVGAVDDTASLDGAVEAVAATDFTAWGETYEGYFKPEIAAPGVDIVSLLASTDCTGYVEHPAHRMPGRWVYSHFLMSGTSMAAPMVAGTAALVHQYHGDMTPNMVKATLMASATPVDFKGAGNGIVNAYMAVKTGYVGSANEGVAPSLLIEKWLIGAIGDSVNWDSVNWDSVNWDSVNWDSVNWDSVNWDSVNWDD